jgi:16S rRNA (adenine1518-N6/adenine1519-N6)-dimethyltransferase
MSQIDTLPPLRDVIATHELRARKSLGQNFLLDMNLTAKIARMAGDLSNTTVLEVGPGPGGLTRGLLAEGAAKVIAVERDHRCIPALAEIEQAYPDRLQVIEGDALAFDMSQLGSGPVKVVANLPYNIGTELLVRWLTPASWPPQWDSLTLMFQREVAERICAAPGSKTYGRLSVLAQWRSTANIVLSVRPEAFSPAPKVHSAVVHIKRLDQPKYPADPKVLQRVVATGFGQRRKMLRASLKSLDRDIENILENLGIDPTFRAETLDLEAWCKIARAMA